MEIDQALEGPQFAAGEEPVDGPLLVHLHVVLEKACGDVTADRFARGFIPVWAKAFGHELEVLF